VNGQQESQNFIPGNLTDAHKIVITLLPRVDTWGEFDASKVDAFVLFASLAATMILFVVVAKHKVKLHRFWRRIFAAFKYKQETESLVGDGGNVELNCNLHHTT
jgi:hypothetical protein